MYLIWFDILWQYEHDETITSNSGRECGGFFCVSNLITLFLLTKCHGWFIKCTLAFPMTFWLKWMQSDYERYNLWLQNLSLMEPWLWLDFVSIFLSGSSQKQRRRPTLNLTHMISRNQVSRNQKKKFKKNEPSLLPTMVARTWH